MRDGETGVLVPPDDVDALSAALEPLMRDPARAAAMGARARARVLSEFSVDAEAARIVAVYRDVSGSEDGLSVSRANEPLRSITPRTASKTRVRA